ncbi:hypothetical protein DXG01_006449 [Tephrocybe rancida]|nr:hypothetical protein DXG01_006449 [Tephrocybe rancida]
MSPLNLSLNIFNVFNVSNLWRRVFVSADYPQQFASEPDSASKVAIINSATPSLFALIIGIGKYRHSEVPDLDGAVNDADEVEKFLISVVSVSKDRIVNLRNEEATRADILNALRSLAHHAAINAKDPILIYFSGHGAEAPPPFSRLETSSPNGKIQMLVPHDFDPQRSEGGDGQGIFDITLSRMLGDIALNKSDNITVIFDCCHSGSGTRKNSSDDSLAVRGIELPSSYSIPDDVFESETRGLSVHESTASSSSHVLLAACKQGQLAMERQGRGVFTSALLTLLEMQGVDRLTYAEVITHLPDLPLQNPQCEGANQHRILFDSRVQSRHLLLYRIQKTANKRNEYTLQAGEAHGVTEGAVFAVYRNKTRANPLGSVVVQHAAQFTSHCSVVGRIPFRHEPTYAFQARIGARQALRLYIEPNCVFRNLRKRIGEEMQSKTSKQSFHIVDNEHDHPDLVLRTEGGLVQFEIKDTACCLYGLTRMPFKDVRADDNNHLFSILCGADDFYWYLRRSNKEGSLTEKVHVECLELEHSGLLTDDLEDIFAPKRNGLNLVVDNTVFITIDDDDDDLRVYGFRITNKSDDPLYAALFYFDASDLSIAPYYLPPTAANDQIDFSLPANGSLTIGFGDSGWSARTYYLRENQSVDVGFLKLYVSTKYVDYSSIVQNTPFHRHRAGPVPPKSKELWDALVIPIIQQKKE